MSKKRSETIREEILIKVKEYYAAQQDELKPFAIGDKINYAGRIYDENEICNLINSSLDFWLTSGKYCNQFEKEFASFLGVKYSLLVNSGSSANLLAFMALTSPLLKERRLKRNDEVITVAAGFPTTINPIIQYGAIPVFVDTDAITYNIDVSKVESAITSKTKAIMIAHTLGNPFDLSTIKKICDKYNLWLIEDNCDALGSKYLIDGEMRYTGTVGDIGTSSFYPPHHMTMGEGGAVYTNNPLLYRIIKSLRDWGRDCMCPSGVDNFCGERFTKQYGELPLGYDHKYVYSHFGYNLKITEMQAAIGVAQLEKLPSFIESRIKNFDYLYQGLKEMDEYIQLPQATKNSSPSWFGFVITVKKIDDRNKIVQYLEKHNIQTRMLFAGNYINHPCFDHIRNDDSYYRVVGELNNTDRIMNSTFWIGLYPGMTKEKLDYMIQIIKEYFNK